MEIHTYISLKGLLITEKKVTFYFYGNRKQRDAMKYVIEMTIKYCSQTKSNNVTVQNVITWF